MLMDTLMMTNMDLECNTALKIVKFVDTIEKGLGENKHEVSISVDVSKTFDSCNHNIILAKNGTNRTE